jgi:hypothetical protein
VQDLFGESRRVKNTQHGKAQGTHDPHNKNLIDQTKQEDKDSFKKKKESFLM